MPADEFMVVCIVAIVMLAGLARTWIRAKHGLPLSDREERRMRRHKLTTPAPDLAAERKITLLSTENERLTGQVSRLEERIAVLERIATDPAERTAREIDALR